MYNIVSHRHNTLTALLSAIHMTRNASIEFDFADDNGVLKVMHPGPGQPAPMEVSMLMDTVCDYVQFLERREAMIDIKPFAFSPETGPYFGEGEIQCQLAGLEKMVPIFWQHGIRVAISCEKIDFHQALNKQPWWNDRDPEMGRAVLFLGPDKNGEFSLPYEDIPTDKIQEIGLIHTLNGNLEKLIRAAVIFGSAGFTPGISAVPTKAESDQTDICVKFGQRMIEELGKDCNPRIVTDFPLLVMEKLGI